VGSRIANAKLQPGNEFSEPTRKDQNNRSGHSMQTRTFDLDSSRTELAQFARGGEVGRVVKKGSSGLTNRLDHKIDMPATLLGACHLVDSVQGYGCPIGQSMR
jgi:hypothetical protein